MNDNMTEMLDVFLKLNEKNQDIALLVAKSIKVAQDASEEK